MMITHLISSFGLSDALLQDEHPDVPETAVIGISHDVKGEGETDIKKIRSFVLQSISHKKCPTSRVVTCNEENNN